MITDPAYLARHFHDMNDDELLYRCSSGSLTELAQSIAIQELNTRGLKLTEHTDASDKTIHYESDFETVAQFLSPTDAHVVCSCLKAAGVPAFIADANHVQMNALLSIALGGVRVMVPVTRMTEAEEVIAAFNRGDFALPDDGIL